jgi:hypothetical protein
MNEPSYFEIQADDLKRAWYFYAQAFGWKFTKAEGLPILTDRNSGSEWWSFAAPCRSAAAQVRHQCVCLLNAGGGL